MNVLEFNFVDPEIFMRHRLNCLLQRVIHFEHFQLHIMQCITFIQFHFGFVYAGLINKSYRKPLIKENTQVEPSI